MKVKKYFRSVLFFILSISLLFGTVFTKIPSTKALPMWDIATAFYGNYPVIKLDSYNRPRMAYSDSSEYLRYAEKNPDGWSGTWDTSLIDENAWVTGNLDMALDKNDHAHIVYQDQHETGLTPYALKYATNQSGSWQYETIDAPEIGSTGYAPAIGITSYKGIFIAYFYYDLADSTNDAVILAYRDPLSATWTTRTLATVGPAAEHVNKIAMAIDSQDVLHLVYAKTSYTLGVPTGYTTEYYNDLGDVDNFDDTAGFVDQPVGQEMYFSLDTYSSGLAGLVYYHGTSHNLNYSSDDGMGGWDKEEITNTLSGDFGQYPSLAINKYDVPIVSYYDNTTGALDYASNEGAGWTTDEIDNSADVGQQTSITLTGGLSYPSMRIAYFDVTNQTINVVKNGIEATPLLDVVGTSSPAGDYGVGDTIPIYFYFNTPVSTIGDVTATFNTGGTCDLEIRNSEYGTCNYTVLANQGATGLNFSTMTGEVVDVYGNQVADFTPVVTNIDMVGTKFLVIDGQAPTLTSFTINSSSYTNSLASQLHVVFNDGLGTGVSQMRCSNNNATWSGWVAYADPLAWNLNWIVGSGQGYKRVYCQVRDLMGNISAVASTRVLYDKYKPTGSIKINNGASSTSSPNAILNLTAHDNLSGVKYMRFSNDKVHWSSKLAYSSTKSWSLTSATYGGKSTHGTKTVYMLLYDRANNVSSVYYDTINYL